jgi:outer membrane protein assembly factor BamE (lipoprotein component of BamABCDE complex)
MTRKQSFRGAQLALAFGLLASAAAAQAATGYDVTHGQEALVHPGMTMAQVRSALGSPEQKIHYANEAGPTWSYQVLNAVAPGTTFNVDFGANGKVASIGQQMADLG